MKNNEPVTSQLYTGQTSWGPFQYEDNVLPYKNFIIMIRLVTQPSLSLLWEFPYNACDNDNAIPPEK